MREERAGNNGQGNLDLSYRQIPGWRPGETTYLLSGEAAWLVAEALADEGGSNVGRGARVIIGEKVEDQEVNILTGKSKGVKAMISLIEHNKHV